MKLFKKKNLVGVDIGDYSIKLVELKPKKKGSREMFELKGIGYELLPPQSIVEGSIMDFTAVSDIVTKSFNSARIKNDNVAIGLSGTSVITKKLSLQKMDEDELEESINFEASGQLTTPIEDVFLDYDIIREDEDKMDLMLVAIKKEKVNEYINVFLQSGKNVEIVDTNHFALFNAVDYNYSIPPEVTYAVINVGASMTNVLIVKEGLPVFTRDVSFGGNNFTDVIQKEFHLDFEKAEMVKKGQTVSGVSPSVVEPSIKAVFNDLKTEINRTLDYYLGTTPDENISKIFLAGGTSKLKNLSGFLEENLNTSVELLNPFQNVYFKEKKIDSEYLHEMESVFGVAVGLAMRKMGG